MSRRVPFPIRSLLYMKCGRRCAMPDCKIDLLPKLTENVEANISENPIFKEFVKMSLIPMISSLSILNYVDMDSENKVLGYGLGLIMLNGMMYVGLPIIGIISLRKIIH